MLTQKCGHYNSDTPDMCIVMEWMDWIRFECIEVLSSPKFVVWEYDEKLYTAICHHVVNFYILYLKSHWICKSVADCLNILIIWKQNKNV